MQALPKIHAYYDKVLLDFSINYVTHALHYLLEMLENMKRLDSGNGPGQALSGRRGA